MIPDQLSDNFWRYELACNGLFCCNRSAPVMPELVTVLQAIRTEFGVPIHVNRGFSCNAYTALRGFTPDSWHTIGGGADCGIMPDVFLLNIYDFAKMIPELGAFGFYDHHFHVDIRPRINGIVLTWDERT